jgi:MFS family permease
LALDITRTSKLLVIYLLVSNLSTMVFMGFYIFFLQANGLSYLEMTIVFAANFLALALFDLPTGNLADKFGRKKSIVVGTFIFALGLLVYALTSSFLLFATAEIVLGIASALLSGSTEAWYVDELKSQGKASEAERVYGLATGAVSVIGVVGGLVGSVLAAYALNLPLLFGSIICFFAGVFALLTFRENYGDKHASYMTTVRRTLRYFKGSPALKLLTFADVLRFCAFIVYIFLYQPFLVDMGLPPSALGIVFAGLMVSTAIGSVLATRLMIRARKSSIVIASVVLLLAPLALLPFIDSAWLAGALFMVCSFAHGLALPASMIWRNALVPSEIRASGLSVMSTFINAANAALSLAMGLVIASFGVEAAFLFGVVAGSVSLPLYVLADRESRKVPNQMESPLPT